MAEESLFRHLSYKIRSAETIEELNKVGKDIEFAVFMCGPPWPDNVIILIGRRLRLKEAELNNKINEKIHHHTP